MSTFTAARSAVLVTTYVVLSKVLVLLGGAPGG
jgi:hypothetical protein